jgi:hypothetical protein
VLLHHADGAAEDSPPAGAASDGHAVQQHGAFVRLEEPGRDLQECGLAGAVLADDRVESPDLERQRDVVDGDYRIDAAGAAADAEALGRPLDADGRPRPGDADGRPRPGDERGQEVTRRRVAEPA